MKIKNTANESGGRTEPAEAESVSVEQENGSVDAMDAYLSRMDAGPGVSRRAEAEPEESDEDEDLNAEAGTLDPEEEDSEEDSAEDEEQDDEQDADAALSERINRKIGKQVARRKAAEERAQAAELRLAELEQELEQKADAPAAEAAPADILFAESDAAVDRHEAELKAVLLEVRRWTDDHDRSDVYVATDANGKEIEYSWAEVRQHQYKIEDLISSTIPQARKAVAKRLSMAEKAKEVYPTLFDRKSEDYVRMQTILRTAPQLKALPDFQLMIGRMLAGEKLETRKPSVRPVVPKPNAAKPPETSKSSKVKPVAKHASLNRKAQTMDEYLGIAN